MNYLGNELGSGSIQDLLMAKPCSEALRDQRQGTEPGLCSSFLPFLRAENQPLLKGRATALSDYMEHNVGCKLTAELQICPITSASYCTKAKDAFCGCGEESVSPKFAPFSAAVINALKEGAHLPCSSCLPSLFDV